MKDLWDQNTPQKFWLCEPAIADADWQTAIASAAISAELPVQRAELGDLLAMTLGEGRFGPDHWQLGRMSRLYYLLKPLLPRFLTRALRRFYKSNLDEESKRHWPIDARYAVFQWELLRQLAHATGRTSIQYRSLWPKPHRFAFVLTHDVENARGQEFVRKVADLEESLGFRSSFNFVLERYPLDLQLMDDLMARGFEVGCHGLKHDGKLFSSKAEFLRRAARINAGMRRYGMVGFRAPLTHRNPDWMQALDMAYDLSFFDTDPYEPIPGGVMGIWPFFMGRTVELPYTLVQDYTLTAVLRESTPRIWLEKVDFLERYSGMALLNSHPDYLKARATWDVYCTFLEEMSSRKGYWQALPRDAAQWWRDRVSGSAHTSDPAYGWSVYDLTDSEALSAAKSARPA